MCVIRCYVVVLRFGMFCILHMFGILDIWNIFRNILYLLLFGILNIISTFQYAFAAHIRREILYYTVGKGVIKILLSNFFYTWPGFFWQYCNDYLLHEKAAKLNNWAGRNREHYHYQLYMSSDLLYTNIQNSFYPKWWTIFRLYSRKFSKDGILNHHIKTTL